MTGAEINVLSVFAETPSVMKQIVMMIGLDVLRH